MRRFAYFQRQHTQIVMGKEFILFSGMNILFRRFFIANTLNDNLFVIAKYQETHRAKQNARCPGNWAECCILSRRGLVSANTDLLPVKG